MINYIAGLKSSIGMKFGFSAWYMIHSMQEKMREDYEGVLSFTAKQIEKYENDLRQYAIIIAADKDLQKELIDKKISEAQSVKRSKNIY